MLPPTIAAHSFCLIFPLFLRNYSWMKRGICSIYILGSIVLMKPWRLAEVLGPGCSTLSCNNKFDFFMFKSVNYKRKGKNSPKKNESLGERKIYMDVLSILHIMIVQPRVVEFPWMALSCLPSISVPSGVIEWTCSFV